MYDQHLLGRFRRTHYAARLLPLGGAGGSVIASRRRAGRETKRLRRIRRRAAHGRTSRPWHAGIGSAGYVNQKSGYSDDPNRKDALETRIGKAGGLLLRSQPVH